MAKRKSLGLIFHYNEGWIGGTYYLLNLVNALNVLPADEKPLITVISPGKEGYDYIKNETNYPHLNFVKDNSKVKLWQKAINAFSLRLLKKKISAPRLKPEFDLVFPNPSSDFFADIDPAKKVFWIFDFQEAHLPEFFGVQDIIDRKQQQIEYAYKAKKIVFSSLDSENDFRTLYPFSKTKSFVVQFSVTHPDFSDIDFKKIKEKFKIEDNYFYCPNQYWAHKNHKVIIEALELLIKKDKDVVVLTSGKEEDWRQPDYAKNLRKLIKEKGLENNFRFLGFLDRKEQLSIMENALAILQPSLFEGWSTVVEDAKALEKFMIISDINVHREQFENNSNALFFDPNNPGDLSQAIESFMTLQLPFKKIDYKDNVLRHANAFMSIFRS